MRYKEHINNGKKLLAAMFILLEGTVNAQGRQPIIRITGTKFPFGIMQKWIDVYTQLHPGIAVALSKDISTDSAELLIAAHSFRANELPPGKQYIAVARYAQLPIVNSSYPDLAALQQKGFTPADLKRTFFTATTNNAASFNVYRRDKNVCASRSFSEKVTGRQQDITGTMVNGDDRALSAAVKGDIHGISYNNLGLVYDLKTRKVADSIAIIPIDLDENGHIDGGENFYGTLDDILKFLREDGSELIPQDDVNIVFNTATVSKEALGFLQWIITSGQEFNNAYGLLKLNATVSADQQARIEALQSNDIIHISKN